MVADGHYTAVLDRFEGEQAVLLLERDGEQVAEYVTRRERLPEPARHPDAVLAVAVRNDHLVRVDYDPDETDRRAESAQSRFDELARRPPDDGE
jgi:hypothetical protein